MPKLPRGAFRLWVFLAMLTLEIAGLTGRYSRVSRLVGGFLLVALGGLLLFRPEWLVLSA